MIDASLHFEGSRSEPSDEHLSEEEVLDRIESLSEPELRKLRLIAQRRAAGTDYTAELLVHEAFCRVLVGERRCPRDTSFAAFLAQSMRSIASHRRSALSRQVAIAPVDGMGNVVGLVPKSDQPNPEEALIEAEAANFVDEFYNLFDGDDEAQLTILALAEGKKGKALQDELGVDQSGYDYIMKRIRRTAIKKYPKGWSK